MRCSKQQQHRNRKSRTDQTRHKVAMSEVQFPLMLDEPSEEDKTQLMNAFFADMRVTRGEQESAEAKAHEALARLCKVMDHRGGQSYKVRMFLRSLWNGNNKADMTEVLCLDWAVRKDLCAVILAFGTDTFFYDELRAAVTKAGHWDFFMEGL
jgi:hypothetical protein